MPTCHKYLKPFYDTLVTIVLWIYFLLGAMLIPVYLLIYLLSKDRVAAFQRLNHRFYKGLLWLMGAVIPGLTIDIDARVRGLGSCVVVSNHLSYLDPVILISLFKKQCTIVKSGFFRFPVFGWIITAAGYIPSAGTGKLSLLLNRRIKHMNDYLYQGGVLFIFPEGTRSRDGRIGPFNKGAFKIARRCNAPIEIIRIANTDKLFTPGRLLFNTCVKNKIEVRWLGRISPDNNERIPIDELMSRTREIMEGNH